MARSASNLYKFRPPSSLSTEATDCDFPRKYSYLASPSPSSSHESHAELGSVGRVVDPGAVQALVKPEGAVGLAQHCFHVAPAHEQMQRLGARKLERPMMIKRGGARPRIRRPEDLSRSGRRDFAIVFGPPAPVELSKTSSSLYSPLSQSSTHLVAVTSWACRAAAQHTNRSAAARRRFMYT